jgi:hypothetical protein
MIRSLATPSMLLSDPSLIVMCDLGSRTARWGLDVPATLRARAEKWSNEADRVRFRPLADIPYVAFDVAFGGKADMTFCGANVCF